MSFSISQHSISRYYQSLGRIGISTNGPVVGLRVAIKDDPDFSQYKRFFGELIIEGVPSIGTLDAVLDHGADGADILFIVGPDFDFAWEPAWLVDLRAQYPGLEIKYASQTHGEGAEVTHNKESEGEVPNG